MWYIHMYIIIIFINTLLVKKKYVCVCIFMCLLFLVYICVYYENKNKDMEKPQMCIR
jgi:hypothetical protein